MSKNFSNRSNTNANYSVKNAALSARKPYSKVFFRLLLTVVLLITAFPLLYEIKSRIGIDIVSGVHAGSFFEKHTGGLIKCQWLYPYHCPSDRMT